MWFHYVTKCNFEMALAKVLIRLLTQVSDFLKKHQKEKGKFNSNIILI